MNLTTVLVGAALVGGGYLGWRWYQKRQLVQSATARPDLVKAVSTFGDKEFARRVYGPLNPAADKAPEAQQSWLQDLDTFATRGEDFLNRLEGAGVF